MKSEKGYVVSYKKKYGKILKQIFEEYELDYMESFKGILFYD